MVKHKFFFTSAIGICMILGALCAYPVCAELAQGDGDPNETAELLTDEKEDTAEDAVATITAEGDFLLPTYLLPVEGETASNDMLEGIIQEILKTEFGIYPQDLDIKTNNNNPTIAQRGNGQD